MIIYKITNLINGKKYIGQTTKSMFDRFRHHCSISNDSYIGRAIKKYGKENFKIDIVCKANNIDELNQREINCIRLFKTLKPNGYNIELGGSNSPRVTSPMKGRKHSSETRLKMSLAAKGKPKSLETRLRMSANGKGKRFSEEVIKKRSQKLIGRKNPGRQVININTGDIYRSVTEASEKLNKSRQTIGRWLKKQHIVQYIEQKVK